MYLSRIEIKAGEPAGHPPHAPRQLPLAAILLLAVLFLGADAHNSPIVKWDESRNIINALEMRITGWSLVTTYDFKPDLWNTKPPLMIWLLNASVTLFGPAEWALRLPALLAGLGALVATYIFTQRVSRSQALGVFAAAIVLLSPGFYGVHGAHTADYDALLTCFTTAYLALLFRMATRLRPSRATAVAAGACIAGAVLTKSSAGLIPGAGVLVFLLASGRLTRVLALPRTWLAALVAFVPVALFYAAREAVEPGYLRAVLHNEFGGRFGGSLIGREEPIYFYVRDMWQGWFFAAPLAPLALFGWRELPGRQRFLVAYCLCTGLSLLAVVSFASTKLPHYALPAYPPLAIAAALLLHGTWKRAAGMVTTASQRVLLTVLAAFLLSLPTVRTLYWRAVSLSQEHRGAESRYGQLFGSLAARGIREATVVEPGTRLRTWHDYAPVLRSYEMLWAEKGYRFQRGSAAPILASCHAETVAKLIRSGPDLSGVPGCVAVRRPRADRTARPAIRAAVRADRTQEGLTAPAATGAAQLARQPRRPATPLAGAPLRRNAGRPVRRSYCVPRS